MLRKILILLAIVCGDCGHRDDKYDERSCREGRGFVELYGHCDGFLPW
jgi:hypothetical protein